MVRSGARARGGAARTTRPDGRAEAPSKVKSRMSSKSFDLSVIEKLFAERNALRADEKYVEADSIRNRLRTEFNVKLYDREHMWVLKSQYGADAELNGYDSVWQERASSLRFVSLEACLARTISWPHVPRLQTYRSLNGKRIDERHKLAEQLGMEMVAQVEQAWSGTVLLVEKPYLDGFVTGFLRGCDARTSSSSSAAAPSRPFVLLAVNGGDGPLGSELQRSIAALPGLSACYAHNLHRPASAEHAQLFHPLPLGAMPINSMSHGDQLLSRARAEAKPWHERDRRLLIAPMKLNSRSRKAYIEVLMQPDFAGCVRIVSDRLPLADFLQLIAQHQSTLSPPGRGYDCFRTWQALSVGTVPLVPEDPAFDMRLLDLGPQTLPAPDELRPDVLATILGALAEPDERATQIGYWEQRWAAHNTEARDSTSRA